MRSLKWAKKLVASITLAAVVFTSLPVEAYALHGTSTEVITKDMVNNDPPEDYVINWDMQADAKDGLYGEYFLKDSLQTVSITIDETNFNYLLQNAIDEPNVMTESVTIGDQTIGYAGLKTKGNYTKTQTFYSTSDRFSFTLNFGKFIKKKDYGAKQNFYGLGKVSFNNLFFDKTAMKEYCALRLMDEMGLPTPEYGMAKLYINDEYYGVYFMVEAMDSSIVERYLQTDDVSDYLTKPIATNLMYDFSMDAYKDENGEFTMDSLSSVLYENEDGDYEAAGELLNSQGLWECDSDTLQDVAEMLPTVLTWQEKLTLLSMGKDFEGNDIDVNSDEYVELLETVVNVDELIRYFAVHSFVIQQDNMFTNFQNYALYVDEAGKAIVVPWDYDLGWGCYFEPYDAEGIANWDLDIMYSEYFWGYGDMTTEEVYANFPLVNVLYQNDELWNRYYDYMEDCAKLATIGGTTSDGEYYEAGRFAKTIDILTPQLIEAASEPMPERVYYLNGAVQPYDMMNGLDDLKNLISKRSVGVWLQTQNINSIVTGYGSDIFKIGNNMTGKYSVSGTLTSVDPETGVFVTANYPVEGVEAPCLDVTTMDTSSEDYTYIKNRLMVADDSDMVVYQMTDAKAPESAYQLYIPVSEEMKSKDTSIYSYADGKLTQLIPMVSDNLYKVQTTDISNIVVVNTSCEFKAIEALRIIFSIMNIGCSLDEIAYQSVRAAFEKIPCVEDRAYVVGNTDNSTLWWCAHSEHYELAANSVTTIEFENYSAEIDIWDNFVSVFTNEAATYGLEQTLGYYTEYAVIRADDFGWGTMGHTLTYSNTHNDWAKFMEILAAANVTMTITREGSMVTINEVVTSIEDPANSYERIVTFEATEEDLFVTLTTEGGYLKINSVVTE